MALYPVAAKTFRGSVGEGWDRWARAWALNWRIQEPLGITADDRNPA